MLSEWPVDKAEAELRWWRNGATILTSTHIDIEQANRILRNYPSALLALKEAMEEIERLRGADNPASKRANET